MAQSMRTCLLPDLCKSQAASYALTAHVSVEENHNTQSNHYRNVCPDSPFPCTRFHNASHAAFELDTYEPLTLSSQHTTCQFMMLYSDKFFSLISDSLHFPMNLISTPILIISFYLIKVLLSSYSRCSPNFSSHSTSMASVKKMCSLHSPHIKEQKDNRGYIYIVNFKSYKKYSPLARRESLYSVTVKHKLAGRLLI